MVIDDRIYGRITIKEPVIADLIQSKPMQRLKHMSQDGAYYMLAAALKRAVELDVLNHDDFFRTDDDVMTMLRQSNDRIILDFLDRLQPGKEFEYVSQADAKYFGSNKTRVIDPWVDDSGTLRHLSELVPGLLAYFDEYHARYAKIGVRSIKKAATARNVWPGLLPLRRAT